MPGGKNDSILSRFSSKASLLSSRSLQLRVTRWNRGKEDDLFTEVKKDSLVSEVLVDVLKGMGVNEASLFGLKCTDKSKHKVFVEESSTMGEVASQYGSPIEMALRFKFYPRSAADVTDPVIRTLLVEQLVFDIFKKTIGRSSDLRARVAALLMQREVGDQSSEQRYDYISSYKLLPDQTIQDELRIEQYWREHEGMSRSDAEKALIQLLSSSESYGAHVFSVIDRKLDGVTVSLAMNDKGLLIYHGNVINAFIPWSDMGKMDYSGSDLTLSGTPRDTFCIISSNNNSAHAITKNHNGSAHASSPNGTLNGVEGKGKKKGKEGATSPSGGGGEVVVNEVCTMKFRFPSHKLAKAAWRLACSTRAFWTDDKAENVKSFFSKPSIPILTRGSSFRFSSPRVFKELKSNMGAITEEREEEADLWRQPLKRQSKRSEQTPLITIAENGHSRVVCFDDYATEVLTKMNKKDDETNHASAGDASVMKDRTPLIDQSFISKNVETLFHMEKVEGLGQAANGDGGGGREGGNARKLLDVGEPLAHSTPVNGSVKNFPLHPSETTVTTTTKVQLISPIKSTISSTQDEFSPSPAPSSPVEEGVSSRHRASFINALFFSFLLLLLLTLVAFVVFEETDLSTSSPFLHSIHTHYYAPVKTHFVRWTTRN